ncbi:MAG: hypothetical protein R3A11_04750 [Bdellovibrionota bacterium]
MEDVYVLTHKIFGSNRTKDESDAFRHFVLGGFLYESFGWDVAESVLYFHESCVVRGMETEMDLYNNFLALDEARELEKKGLLTKKNLICRAKKMLEDKKLMVLRHSINLDFGQLPWECES